MSKEKTGMPVVQEPQEKGLLVIPDPAKLREIMKNNLEGLSVEFTVVKMPSAGGLVFEIPSLDGELETPREIIGVVLAHHATRAYFKESFGSGVKGAPPSCSSMDGKHGEGDPGGECSVCPQNAWGSGRDAKGQPTRGKGCAERHRLFILRGDSLFPIIVSAPPSSLKNVSIYATKLAGQMKELSQVLTKLKLLKATNPAGIEYSKIDFYKAGDLSQEQADQVKQLIVELLPAMRKTAIIDAEFEAEKDADTY